MGISLIAYVGSDEIIVTTPEMEPVTLEQYFEEGGRDLDEYDRETSGSDMAFLSRVHRD